jgi:hypothetical protein
MDRIINKYDISYMRIPIELRYSLKSYSILKRFIFHCKRYLLKRWGKGLNFLLNKYDVKTANYLVGAASSCEINYDYLSSVLTKLQDKDGIVEVMLHPGYSESELKMILSVEFKNLLTKFEKFKVDK